MNGNRKMKGFYVTQLCVLITYVTAMFCGVQLDSQTVMMFGVVHGAVAGAFFGANFGEHFTQAKKAVNQPTKE